MLKRHPKADWIIHLKDTESTMLDADVLLKEGANLPERILIVAETQRGGIGRSNNSWISPLGGIWFTYLLKSEYCHPQISLLLGLCLRQSVMKHFPTTENHLQMKWPNDLLYDDKKIAGILTKSVRNYLCIGIGINTNIQNLPLVSNLTPTSLQLEMGFRVSNTALTATFLDLFDKIYSEYQKSGMQYFIAQINACLHGIHHSLSFDKGTGTIQGTNLGVNDEGALLIESANGHITQNYSGSIIRCEP